MPAKWRVCPYDAAGGPDRGDEAEAFPYSRSAAMRSRSSSSLTSILEGSFTV
jgi:hypothetical protein